MENLFKETKREIFCQDANKWLVNNKNHKAIITSLPDMEEINKNKEDWVKWIKSTCENLAAALDDRGVIFFYQTDRKYKGQIIDKKTIISSVFLQLGYKNIISKIVLKQNPDTVNLFRPTYTNLFAFSKKVTSGRATPDVIYSGKMIYKNAMGFNACKVAIDFIDKKIGKETILDPFCGQGSVLHIANKMGFNSVGVEILKEQSEKAKKLN